MTRFLGLLVLPLALVSLPAHATTTGIEPGEVDIYIVAPVDGAEVSSPVDVVVVDPTGALWEARVLVDGVPSATCDLWDLAGSECTMSIPMVLGPHTITVLGEVEGDLIDEASIDVTVISVDDTDGTGSGGSESDESHGPPGETGDAESGSTASVDDGVTTGSTDDGATGGSEDGASSASGGGADGGRSSRGCSIGDAGGPLPLLGLLALAALRRRSIGLRSGDRRGK